MTATRPGIPHVVSTGLLIKLGSLVVHGQELLEDRNPAAREFDEAAIRGLVYDSEVQGWLAQFASGFLPAKRATRGGYTSEEYTPEIKRRKAVGEPVGEEDLPPELRGAVILEGDNPEDLHSALEHVQQTAPKQCPPWCGLEPGHKGQHRKGKPDGQEANT